MTMKTALRLLRHLLPPEDEAFLEGCYEEMYDRAASEKGRPFANRWIWSQVLRSIPGFVRHWLSWKAAMLRTHLVVTRRHILRHKGFFLIKIFGLAAGIGCAVVIILYVTNELTYDAFHPGSERIFRIATRRISPSGDDRFATSPGPMLPAIRRDSPQVEASARIIAPYENAGHVLAVQGEKRFFEKRVWFVDPELFDVLRIPVLEGSPRSALVEPQSVVITKSTARKYFGSIPAVGQSLRLELDYDTGASVIEDFQVRGVVRDAPANTHWKYDILVSMSTLSARRPDLDTDWREYHTKYTYLKLAPAADRAALEKQLAGYAESVKSQATNIQLLEFYLQPIRSIHLGSNINEEMEAPGSRYYIYVYSFVALLILLIGVMNYVNLSASLSATRTREVGVRKVAGSRRRDLVFQFLSESGLITLLAFLLSLIFASFLLRSFNAMAGTSIALSEIWRPEIWPAFVLLFLAVILAAGGYPAMILSSFKPASMLRGEIASGRRGSAVQRLLVVGQFAISIFLVVCTLVVFRQLGFMKGRSLGFDREQKLVLEIKSDQARFRQGYEAIKTGFLQNSGIKAAAVSSLVPGVKSGSGYYLRRGESYSGPEKPFRLKVITVDQDFLSLYGIGLAAGRAFQRESTGDGDSAFIVNETGARELGFSSPDEALGARFTAHYNRRTKSIVGVTKDFHFLGMKESAEPLILDIEPSLLRYLTLSLAPGRIRETMAFVEKKWGEQFPGVPFEYFFLDESFDRVYRYEEQMGKLLGIVAGLGISVAFLGLFGLVAFTSRLRRKEIAIRKVVGAPTSQIVFLMSRRFVRLIILAAVLAVPSAWLAANKWLQDFAYRIKPGIPVFAFALAAAFLIALAAVLVQGIKADRDNPADVLRHE